MSSSAVMGAVAWQEREAAEAQSTLAAEAILARETALAYAEAEATARAEAEQRTIQISTQNRINQALRLSSAAVLMAGAQYDLALLLAAEAAHLDANREVQSNLAEVLKAKPQLLAYLRGHTEPIVDIAFSPDGKYLASGGADQSLLLWDIEAGRLLDMPSRVHTDTIFSLAFSPDSQVLASGGLDRQVILWDVPARWPIGPPLASHPGPVVGLAFSPDGAWLAACSGHSIFYWDVQTHKLVRELRLEDDVIFHDPAFSPDGSLLASGSWDGEILLWSMQDREPVGEPLAEPGDHMDLVKTLAFIPDGRLLVSASIGEGPKSQVRGHTSAYPNNPGVRTFPGGDPSGSPLGSRRLKPALQLFG